MQISWTWLVTFWFGFELFVRAVAFYIVPRNRKPSSATGWLLLIMLFPTIGLFTFLLIGSPKLNRRRRAAQDLMDSVIHTGIENSLQDPKQSKYVRFDVVERYQPFVSLNTTLSKLPAFTGNDVELLPNYDDILTRIAADIHQAKKFVHVEFFIIAMDEATEQIFTAMEKAAERGVHVRVLFDSIGAWRYPRYKEMKKRLTEAGIQWCPMLPLRMPGMHYTRPDLRNHRKIVIVDGAIGYTGSLNLVRRDYHRKDEIYYDELMVRLRGPIVAQLQGVFITDWFAECGELLSHESKPELDFTLHGTGNVLAQTIPSGPGYEYENNLKLFSSLVYAAKKRVVITNPYFVPDESLLAAILTATQRGIEVIIINSSVMDQKMVGHAQRSYYEELLRAGVKIYWYKAPILLHSKHMTVDDDISIIGSSNFDIRSFELNLEISLAVYDQKVTRHLQEIEAVYLSRSERISLEDWRQRPWHAKLRDNLARLTAALQ